MNVNIKVEHVLSGSLIIPHIFYLVTWILIIKPMHCELGKGLWTLGNLTSKS